ncbi:hypothetical protein FSARC_7914 [Fusarium sarcochroum]|uniref:Uncharacterized protein n=1 Tax=Fusarium sarcochroum TaxID=1208366 RepID=A0A8H4TU86_9HYPO|nr:hypothetical protein FSARC_7914 [Fusarium sarcochroum]
MSPPQPPSVTPVFISCNPFARTVIKVETTDNDAVVERIEVADKSPTFGTKGKPQAQRSASARDHSGSDQAIDQHEHNNDSQSTDLAQVSGRKRKHGGTELQPTAVDAKKKEDKPCTNTEDISKGNGARSGHHGSNQGSFTGTIDDAYEFIRKSLGTMATDEITVVWWREDDLAARRRRLNTPFKFNLGEAMRYVPRVVDEEADRVMREIQGDQMPGAPPRQIGVTLNKPDTDNEKCGNCRQTGHEVSRCWHVNQDGFITGCAICNAHDHLTLSCSQFPKDIEGQVRLIVIQRANLPPLEGKFWYPLMWKYMEKYPATDVKGLPWSLEFSKTCHQGTWEQEQLALSMTWADEDLRPVDPETKSWEAAKKHFNGNPKSRKKAKRAFKADA